MPDALSKSGQRQRRRFDQVAQFFQLGRLGGMCGLLLGVPEVVKVVAERYGVAPFCTPPIPAERLSLFQHGRDAPLGRAPFLVHCHRIDADAD
jgi:hypothetical protein